MKYPSNTNFRNIEPFPSTVLYVYKIALILIHDNVGIKNSRHILSKGSKKMEFIS